MAYVPKKDEQDERLLPQDGGALMAPVAGNSTTDGKPTSSGFVNLQRYLDVNKDRAAGMADSVIGETDKEGKALADDVKYTADAFSNANTGVKASSVNYGGPLGGTYRSALDAADADISTAKYKEDVDAGTASFLKSPLSNWQYDGVNEKQLQDSYGNAQGAAERAKSFSDKTYSDSVDAKTMRAQALRRLSGNVTVGGNALDAFLAEGGGAEKFAAKKGEMDRRVVEDSKGVNKTALDTKLAAISSNRADADDFRSKFTRLAGLMSGLKSKPVPVIPQTIESSTAEANAPVVPDNIASGTSPLNPITNTINRTTAPTIQGSSVDVGNPGQDPIGALESLGTKTIGVIPGAPTSQEELKNRIKIKKPKW